MKLYTKYIITDQDGSPYLIRRSLTLPFGYRLKLHHILRSDHDRHLHDHPWGFVSIVLWGGYYEEIEVPDPFMDDGVPWRVQVWRRVGSIAVRRAKHKHRVILRRDRPAWTLILRGRRVREWGFWTECGWQQWRRYLAKAWRGVPICEDED